MTLVAAPTGSYPPVRFPPPPLTDREVEDSIRDAIAQQRNAIQDKDIRWLFVDGQPRGDIVGIFAHGLGLTGKALPYKVTGEIEYRGPITLHELGIAAVATNGRPLKAHITGPTVIVESCELTSNAPLRYRDDPEFPHNLILDLARALAEEARQLISTPGVPVTHIQIDEPTLAYGADLQLASEAVGIITQVARDAGIPTILHACGNTGAIMESLLEMPVDILNVEGKHLRDLPWLDGDHLTQNAKRLAIGCIPVNIEDVPSVELLERELLIAIERYGAVNIWGITHDCGLRMSDPQLAQKRLQRLAEVAHRVSPWFES